ncbi:MAG: arginine--tRNA ligase [Candidatus Levybacteria bacterium]|nr:arginine--tRNA ligase [Candidatus Levybacteria bacterium]
MGIKDEIIGLLKDALKEEGFGTEIKFSVECPADSSHGDYSTNIAMVLWANQELGIRNHGLKTPMDLAQKLVNFIIRDSQFMIHFKKVEAVKPGFINFWISEEYLFSQLKQVLEQKEKFGSKNEDPNKKIVVEYSSPNIAKPFTVGHLRSTIIGDAVANLLQANGWKVFRDNHLGDWGTQFGKQIYAIKTWGDEKKIEDSQNPMKELVALYVKFHEEAEKNPELEEKAREWFKKLEDGDEEARRLWEKCIDWSWREFENIYGKLNVPAGEDASFENEGRGYGESFFEDKMTGVIQELKEKGLLREGEQGAKLVFFEKDKYPPLMILKQDGTTLYATRDLATDKFRLERYGKDVVVINEVGAEQSLYFKQLFEVEKMLGWFKEGQRIHIRHGLYRFKDQKMSTRKGNVIWLEDLLRLAREKANDIAMSLGTETKGNEIVVKSEKLVGQTQREITTEQIAIGALKWNDLKRSSNLDIVFDWDEILNMQGNSGPYLQYTYARTQSVIAKSRIQNSEFRISLARPRLARLEVEEVSLLRALNRFSEVVEEAGEKFAPNILCNYLFNLAQKFNLFYQKCKIISSENQDFRLELTQTVGQTLKNGLNLLGISAPERM